jgi:recombinase/recombinase-like zinc beta ribbon protein
MGLPVGLVYDPSDKIVLDPDLSVREAISHLFAVFARTGSARAVVQEFARDGLLFPVRIRKGGHKGELTWTPLSHWQVLRTLHNPRYAGAFAYGRRREARTPDGKKTFLTLPREQWTALFCDSHPGYLTWEQFEINQQLLAANAQAHGRERDHGPAREGPALLQGLAICGRCGRRMTVRYHVRRGVPIPDYQCMRASIDTGGPRCLTVPGGAVDAAIGQLLLDTVTPLALDVALSVQAELENRAEEADALRRRRVERAREHADLARRRYLAVDPNNRLVADSLEADWNGALRALREAEDDYDKAAAQAAEALSEQNKTRIRGLATDFPALWSDPATAARERKRMTRLIIEDVTLVKTEQIHAHVRFRGGTTTSLTLPIPPTAWQARQTHPDTVALLDRLLDDHTDAQTAEQLNAAGHRSGEGKPFTAAIVIDVRRKYRLPNHTQRLRDRGLLTLTEIAELLHVHPHTIKDWHHAGLLAGHQANDKNEQLYEPPNPGDPRLVKHLGSRLNRRVLSQPAPGGAV